MKRIITLALTFLLPVGPCVAAAAAATEIPEGVKYTPASETETAAATTRLRDALKGGPTALAPLLGLDADHTVLVGPYLGLEIHGDGLDGRQVLSMARYNLPVPGQAPLVVESFRAKERAQKLFLAHYLHFLADFAGPLTIRAPSFDELAITWAWVAWDLEGPVLVAEGTHDKYLFHFEPKSGHLFWIERLTQPCFSGQQEGRQVLGCTCTGIARDGRRWSLRFDVRQSCPATGLHQVSAVAFPAAGAPAMPSAYIEVSDRTARVDAMLARRFGASYSLTALPVDAPGYKGPGKLLEGKPPEAPKDERGETVHGYVLLGSVIGPDGRASDNRVLLTTDERVAAAVLEAAQGWRLEPATRDGKPVAEIVWQELPL